MNKVDTNAYAVAQAFSNNNISDMQMAGIGIVLVVLIIIGVWSQIKDPPRKK